MEERAEQEGRGAFESDEFLTRLTHELRSPLSPILTWAGLLRDESLDPSARAAAAAAIERSARSLQAMIEDLSVAVRSSPSSLALGPARVDLAALVRDVAGWFSSEVERKGLSLHVRCREALVVSGDAKRLRQIVRNLIENAVKFTETGGRVTVVAERLGDVARLRVSDTGRGLGSGDLGRVLDGDRPVPSTKSDRGLGLGLAAVKRLVHLHDGSIVAESAGEGRGAAFTVELPLDAPELPAPAADPSAARVRADFGGARILVVDDEPDVTLSVSTLLALWGAEVRAVQTASEALGELSRLPFDVLISDIAMPRHDGYALVLAVRDTEARLGARRLPAVALTAHSRELERRKAVAAGFDAVVAKPVEADELRATLGEILAGSI